MTDYFEPATDDVVELIQAVIAQNHPDLIRAKFAVVFRSESQSSRGQRVYCPR